ncbi:evasin P1134-like [Ixodes scapularis]|uniref:evasin P1134-like n=1 Tax=Ixodes scapularis TaxID=6945 RepID=UPI001C38C963|nr:evasin P1134-like [Ixodes scapularis]
MEVKTFAFLQITVFIALGIQLFVAGTYADISEDELFTVKYCGMNCTQKDDGSWTACSDKNEECKCFHESDKTEGLCLSTEYTDFTQYEWANSSEIDAATPLPPGKLVN